MLYSVTEEASYFTGLIPFNVFTIEVALFTVLLWRLHASCVTKETAYLVVSLRRSHTM